MATYQHPHAMGMETERKIAAELMRDLLVDWIPEYEGDDQTTDCPCSAHRARRYVRAAGIELRGPTTTNAPSVRPSS